MHSTYSDGKFTNEQVFELAKKNKVDMICITNHDTVNGFDEIEELSKKYGVKAIYGVELSTYLNNESVHVLGYFKKNDYNYPELKNFLVELKENRDKRCQKIFDLLKLHYNIDIDCSELLNQNAVITRGHIGKLISKKLNMSVSEVFNLYLKEGCKCYLPSSNLSTEEGIKLLKRNNCICVLAHPVLLKKNKAEDIIPLGIDGIEAFYPYNQISDSRKYCTLADDNNLLVTAGSDFHGAIDEKHNTIGYCFIEDNDIKKLLVKLELE